MSNRPAREPDGGQAKLIRVNRARESLERGCVIVGATTGGVCDAAAVYALASGGCDFVFIDLEHTSMDLSGTARLVLDAHAAGMTPLVRVPEISRTWIGRVLDTGCQAILVPGIESPDDVDLAIDAAFYHPIGHRGMGLYGGPATGFRQVTDVQDVCAAANAQILLGLLVENQKAMRCLDELLRPEIGFVLFGAQDMAQDFRWSNESDVSGAVNRARAQVSEACKQRGIPFAMSAHSLGDINIAVSAGARLVIHGGILQYIQQRVRLAVDEIEGIVSA